MLNSIISFIANYAAEIVVLMMVIIGLLVTIQPDKERTKIAAIYGLSLFAHLSFSTLMLKDYGEFLFISHTSIFFWTAGAVDLAIITFIAGRSEITRMSAELQMISGVSLLYNAGGWLMYQFEYLIPVYHIMFIAIYSWSIIALMKVENKDARHNRVDHRFIAFRFNDCARNIIHFNH